MFSSLSGWFNKHRVNCIDIPIQIICPREPRFDVTFTINAPYDDDHPYSVHSLIEDIMKRVHRQHRGFKLIPSKIHSDSFLGQEIVYRDYDWKESAVNLKQFNQTVLQQYGIVMDIDLEIFLHNPARSRAKCPHTKCPIYSKMKNQYIFSEKYLNHLREHVHDHTPCRYKNECKAFIRIVKGGYRLDDRCHLALYQHPPRDRVIELEDDINAFGFNPEWAQNRPLHYVTAVEREEMDYDEDDGYLKQLLGEVVANGFESDLYLNPGGDQQGDYTLMKVVDQKLECKRHRQMGSPLNRSEMLSLILYSGCYCNYDLCAVQRRERGDFEKWKWFDLCLFTAINKLSRREHGAYAVFTGLKSVKLDHRHIHCGYFRTYVSTSWDRKVADEFGTNKDGTKKGMLFEFDPEFRENAICCDISWISKFQGECEVLFARSIDAERGRFQCTVTDTENGRQIVSLQSHRMNVMLSDSVLSLDFEDEKEMENVPVTAPTIHSEESKETHIPRPTEIDREIVLFFICSFQRELNRVISSDIIHLITLYTASIANDKFSECSDDIEITKNGRLFTATQSKSLSVIFWEIETVGNVVRDHKNKWCFVIQNLKRSTFYNSNQILFGIQDRNMSFPQGFSGWDDRGKRYINGNDVKSPTTSLETGDIIIMAFDGRRSELKYHLNGTEERTMNVAVDRNCFIAVYLRGNGTQIRMKRKALRICTFNEKIKRSNKIDITNGVTITKKVYDGYGTVLCGDNEPFDRTRWTKYEVVFKINEMGNYGFNIGYVFVSIQEIDFEWELGIGYNKKNYVGIMIGGSGFYLYDEHHSNKQLKCESEDGPSTLPEQGQIWRISWDLIDNEMKISVMNQQETDWIPMTHYAMKKEHRDVIPAFTLWRKDDSITLLSE